MQISEQVFQEFKKVIDRVLDSPRSDFYSKKFASENFDLRCDLNKAYDIVRVPRLTREELAVTSPLERLYDDLGSVKYIRYTSGTSGAHMLLLFRPEQRYRIPGKRPLVITANNQLDHYFAAAPRAAEAPYFPALIHSNQSMRVTAELAKYYDIDAIVGLASKMIALGKGLSRETREQIQDLFIQGERYTPDLSHELEGLYQNARQDPRYGMTEVGLFGYQCEDLRKMRAGVYHCEKDYLFEVSDAQTGKWLGAGDEGEILITELYESPHQIIRYRTGDAGRIVSAEPCVCGALFTFEVTGRIEHDIIKVAGGVIRTDEIERVIGELWQWFEPDFRGVVEVTNETEGIQAVFTITLIPKPNISRHPLAIEAMRQEIAKRMFLTPTKTLDYFLKGGRIARFDIVFVEMFSPEIKAQRLRFKERGADSPQ